MKHFFTDWMGSETIPQAGWETMPMDSRKTDKKFAVAKQPL